jgi:DNA (cytosine-5)-methyltransferase 3A
MNVLSLFDGMSCGQIALERAGIKVDNYFASEIDKHAIKVTQKNYPNTIQLGDVTKIKAEDLPKIDLIIGGSPCQGFSFAGKQLNFEDPRSKLFFEFVRLVDDLMPSYFLLENVKMKKEHQNLISSFLGVQPIEMNSSLLSAQNRIRFYWTNIKGFNLPEDKNINLIDLTPPKKINFCLKGYDHLTLKEDQDNFKAGDFRIAFLKSILYKKPKGKSSKTYLAAELINDTPSKKSRQGDRIYCQSAKGPCLTKMDNRIKIVDTKNDNSIRFLTIEEYEQMQTVTPGYTFAEGVTEKHRREMLGNGWTVDAIVEFFKNLPK